jgi:hypothetical protein
MCEQTQASTPERIVTMSISKNDDTTQIIDNLIDAKGFAKTDAFAKEFKIQKAKLLSQIQEEVTPVWVDGKNRYPAEEVLHVIVRQHTSRMMRQKAKRVYKEVIRLQASGHMPIWYRYHRPELNRLEKLVSLVCSDERGVYVTPTRKEISIAEADFQQDLRRGMTYGEYYTGPVEQAEIEREITGLIAAGIRKRAEILKARVGKRRAEMKAKFSLIDCSQFRKPAYIVRGEVAVNA